MLPDAVPSTGTGNDRVQSADSESDTLSYKIGYYAHGGSTGACGLIRQRRTIVGRWVKASVSPRVLKVGSMQLRLAVLSKERIGDVLHKAMGTTSGR